MECPSCKYNILRKERTGHICSRCNKEFAFDPKLHTLKLTDSWFQRAVAKISENDKLYFTSQQFHFFLSHKNLKTNGTATVLLTILLTFIAFLSTLFITAGTQSIVFGIVVAIFWLIIISLFLFFRRPTKLLPQSFWTFESEVLGRWERVYKTSPQTLIKHNTPIPQIDYPVKGLLLCENYQIGECLVLNQTTKDLGLALIGRFPENLTEEVSALIQQYGNLPIYVLHDASLEGCAFTANLKRELDDQRQIIDIGFRPREVMKSNLVQFRQNDDSSKYLLKTLALTAEEIKWLSDGFYTPLFVLKPAKLIKYVTGQVSKKSRTVPADNAEKKAEAIGFMTWVDGK